MTNLQAVEFTDDQVLGTRLLAVALMFAPNLNALVDPERATAVLILTGVTAEAKTRNSRFVRGERTMSSGVDYITATWFSDEDRAALVNLSNKAPVPAVGNPGAPVGNFPKDYTTSNIWHEYYPGDGDVHYQQRPRGAGWPW